MCVFQKKNVFKINKSKKGRKAKFKAFSTYLIDTKVDIQEQLLPNKNDF